MLKPLIFLGVLNGLAPALTLNGVALGVNTFSATSTSANNNKITIMLLQVQ
jgi:hypothetical protein